MKNKEKYIIGLYNRIIEEHFIDNYDDIYPTDEEIISCQFYVNVESSIAKKEECLTYVIGHELGFNDNEIQNIIIELVDEGYLSSTLGMTMIQFTELGIEYCYIIKSKLSDDRLDEFNMKFK